MKVLSLLFFCSVVFQFLASRKCLVKLIRRFLWKSWNWKLTFFVINIKDEWFDEINFSVNFASFLIARLIKFIIKFINLFVFSRIEFVEPFFFRLKYVNLRFLEMFHWWKFTNYRIVNIFHSSIVNLLILDKFPGFRRIYENILYNLIQILVISNWNSTNLMKFVTIVTSFSRK